MKFIFVKRTAESFHFFGIWFKFFTSFLTWINTLKKYLLCLHGHYKHLTPCNNYLIHLKYTESACENAQLLAYLNVCINYLNHLNICKKCSKYLILREKYISWKVYFTFLRIIYQFMCLNLGMKSFVRRVRERTA